MYGFIYLTTNNINNKKYIGQKTYSSHDWKTYLGSGINIRRAIKKYGKENFTREILDEAKTREELNQKEIYWISHFDAVNSNEFYNIASGGDGGNTVAGYSKEEYDAFQKSRIDKVRQTIPRGENSATSILKEFQVLEIIEKLLNKCNIKEMSKYYGVSVATISDIRNYNTWKHLTENIVFPNIMKEKRSRSGVPVTQYDEFGNYIKTYPTARQAEKETGVGYKLICQVCRGEKRIAHGYIWRYKDDPIDKYETQNTHMVSVDQYDMDGNLINTFESIKKATLLTGASPNYVIKGKGKTSGGYYWVRHGEKLVL